MPKSAAQSRTSGSIAIGMPSRPQISSFQRPSRMSKSSVRAALVASVTWARPPVSRQISQLSTVPNRSSPRSRPLARALDVVEDPASLVPEK